LLHPGSVEPAEEAVTRIEGPELLVGLDQGSLRDVPGLFAVPQQPVGRVEKHALVAGDDRLERGGLPPEAARHQSFVGIPIDHKYRRVPGKLEVRRDTSTNPATGGYHAPRLRPRTAEGGPVSAGQTRRLSVPATDEGIKAALDALERLWAEQGVSRAVTWPVEVSLDEVLANVVHHGLEGRGESAQVELELQFEPGDPPRCEVRVGGDVPEFDPLAAAC